MAVQFRQIGVPDGRQTNAEVRQLLRRARQRTEALLNRPVLPGHSALLTALTTLQRTIQAAYTALPLQRLNQMQQRLNQLHDDVDRGAYFGFHPSTLGVDQTLRQFYSDVTGLIVDLTTPLRPRRDPEADGVLKKFLERAAERGWRVPETQPRAVEQQDGFAQSVDYLRKIAVQPQTLLPLDTEFGITTGSIVLMTEHPIPESTLASWANHQDVYVVFGHYVVLPNIRLLGVTPPLVLTNGSNGTAIVNISRFELISELVQDDTEPITDKLIRYPRRVQHHYYCPLVSVNGTDRRYFKTWDLLVQQEQ